jgi:citronellol/citronellal dehydrogenase
MSDQPTLHGKTVLVTGASRGIGRAIAVRAARDGANVVICAKTTSPHPKLPGTIGEAAAECGASGGEALAVKTDLLFDDQITDAVWEAEQRFGGIDVLVNNASALGLTGTLETTPRMFDRMHGVNARGSFMMTRACLPHLLKAENPHVLNIAPPLNMEAKWFKDHGAYSLAKYAMSVWVLGMAAEFAEQGVAFNALWPKTTIATAAVRNLLGGEPMVEASRQPAIMGDAAHAVVTRDSRACTGNFFTDEGVLQEAGVTDFEPYAVKPGTPLCPDFFLD